jgi:hypothetical protein
MPAIQGDQFECFAYTGQQTRLNTDATKTLLQRLVDEGKITQEESESCFKTIDTLTIKSARRDVSLKTKWVAPTLGPNTTPEKIADDLGAVRERIKLDQKTEGFLKEAIKARGGLDPNAKNNMFDPEKAAKAIEEAMEARQHYATLGVGFDTE